MEFQLHLIWFGIYCKICKKNDQTYIMSISMESNRVQKSRIVTFKPDHAIMSISMSRHVISTSFSIIL